MAATNDPHQSISCRGRIAQHLFSSKTILVLESSGVAFRRACSVPRAILIVCDSCGTLCLARNCDAAETQPCLPGLPDALRPDCSLDRDQAGALDPGSMRAIAAQNQGSLRETEYARSTAFDRQTAAAVTRRAWLLDGEPLLAAAAESSTPAAPQEQEPKRLDAAQDSAALERPLDATRSAHSPVVAGSNESPCPA